MNRREFIGKAAMAGLFAGCSTDKTESIRGDAAGGGARSTWGRGLEGAAAVKAAGYNAIVPVWGERIV